MSGKREAAQAWLDAGSRQTLLRAGMRSFGIAAVIFWPWLAGLRPLETALDTMMVFGAAASLFCGMVAILLRERFGRGSLNHWDEALFYTAIARLAHLAHA